MGGTPYLWIFFRAGRFFPSWGGSNPWWEWLKNWRIQTPFQAAGKGPIEDILASGGWAALLFAALGFFLWTLNYFKWKAGNRSFYPAHTFWVWVLSGLGAVFFFSPESGTLGPVAPAFLIGLAEMSLRLLERGEEKRHATFFSGVRLSGTAGGVLILGLGLAALPGQHYFRSQYYFPEQHAMNLLQAAAGRSLLVCDDPFEAEACLEARIIEPLSLGSVILEKRYLNQKWYVAQCIEAAPELMFSGLVGSSEGSLKSLVLNNRNQWAVHWAVSTLPAGWKEPKAFPTVLTQEFEGSSFSPQDPEGVQYRFDLTALPKKDEALDAASAHYLSRYVTGFNDLGKKMMDQGLYMASIHAFDRALKLDPSFAEPQSLLAQMYSQQKILEAAQLEFEKTIKDHPKRINDLMNGLERAQKEKDESGSVTLLDEMIRLNSELADAQYQLSIIYNRQGRTQESKALLESSVQLNPKQIEAQLTMGRLMSKMGNRIKAEEAFRAVLGVNPENKEAQVELWKLLNK
jgi:tetratricopeptide (TPR) repeat protein